MKTIINLTNVDGCNAPVWSYATGGGFASVNYPNDYDSDVSCDYFIVAIRGNRVNLTFFEIQTEEIYDEVIVRDGITLDSPILLRFSGSTENITVTSTVPKIHIGFKSDSSVQYRGFSLTWDATY
jgi:CUB domain